MLRAGRTLIVGGCGVGLEEDPTYIVHKGLVLMIHMLFLIHIENIIENSPGCDGRGGGDCGSVKVGEPTLGAVEGSSEGRRREIHLQS